MTKYLLLAYCFLLSVGCVAQYDPAPGDTSWIKIKSIAYNHTIDEWVRRGSPAEIAARPSAIHDTIYIDSFRNKIWELAARLHKLAPPELVQYDSTMTFSTFRIGYTYTNGFFENGHLSKKRHSRQTGGGQWVSGDFYYVIRAHVVIDSYPWEEKRDTLCKSSNYDKARKLFSKKVYHRVAVDDCAKGNLYDRYELYLDNYTLRTVTVGLSSAEL